MGVRFNEQQKLAYVSTYLLSFLAIFFFVNMNHIQWLWPNDLIQICLIHVAYTMWLLCL